MAVLWSISRAGVSDVLNQRGFGQLSSFFRAAIQPDLSGDLLRIALDESITTVSYALLGTVLSIGIGLIGGIFMAESMWSPITRRWSPTRRFGWRSTRALMAIPRSIHEVVWGLLLINVLGNDPWVAVIAIGIPFGSVTAKVFSEFLDEVHNDSYKALRIGGASRLQALLFGSMPEASGDLLSYGFYRLECAIRSAAVLGVIGAGGLGFQLQLSFTSLDYNEMWTFLYALIILSGLADWWSSSVRRRHASPNSQVAEGAGVARQPGRDRFLSWSAISAGLAVPISWWWLDLSPSNLWSARTQRLFSDLVTDSFPATVTNGFGSLFTASVDTVAMAVLAIAVAFLPATGLAFVIARRSHGRQAGTSVSLASEGARFLTRLFLLTLRAIPPPVWAFLTLFVMFPGIWPGAVALGIYNAGVMARLQAEVVENYDDSKGRALEAAGVPRVSRIAYATAPQLAGRFSAIGMYRWEVAIRETVVVGVVGAAGLGRVVDEQVVRFDYDGLTSTLIALMIVTIAADQISAGLRRSLR